MGMLTSSRRRKDGSRSGGVAGAAIADIKRTWSVDESRVTPHEHGFDWLPTNHMVRVRLDEGDGSGRTRITIATDFLRTLPVSDPSFVRLAGNLPQHHCLMYALVYPPHDVTDNSADGHMGEMRFHASAYVDENLVGWLPSFLAQMSIMQPIDAEMLSDDASKFFGFGQPTLAGASRRDLTADDVMMALPHMIDNAGMEPSRWIGEGEFKAFAEMHARNDACFGFGDDERMTLETPFGSDSALITFTTDQPRTAFGNGLHITSQIRLSQPFEEACAIAARLNHLESERWTDFPQLGCWHPAEAQEGMANLHHTVFVPNFFYRPGLIANFALWALDRTQWARGIVLPHAKNLTMRESLEARNRP
jgi:hypothetical protein